MQVKLKVKLVLLPQKMFFCPKHISNGAFLCCKAPLLCLLISEDLKRPEACLRLSAVFFFFFRNSALEDRSLFTNFFFLMLRWKMPSATEVVSAITIPRCFMSLRWCTSPRISWSHPTAACLCTHISCRLRVLPSQVVGFKAFCTDGSSCMHSCKINSSHSLSRADI